MVCLDTPTSRATSSTARPAATCFKALIISASLCLPLDMVLPLSFDEIIFNFVRNQGSRSKGAVLVYEGKYAEAVPFLERDNDNAFSLFRLAYAGQKTGN